MRTIALDIYLTLVCKCELISLAHIFVVVYFTFLIILIKVLGKDWLSIQGILIKSINQSCQNQQNAKAKNMRKDDKLIFMSVRYLNQKSPIGF